MKGLFRLMVMALMLGGWALASASMYVVRTDTKLVVVTKDHLTYSDTYVDTRHWTLDNVRQHPAVVARLLELNKGYVLADTVDARQGPVESQLIDALDHPETPPPTTTAVEIEKVKTDVHAATQETKSIFDFN
jgi:hypothetical protein